VKISVGVTLKGPDGNPLDAAGVMARARAVEAADLDGIWMGDALGDLKSQQRPDPLMWLLVAAAATERIHVGTCILIVPLRHPVELAQRLITMHALTRGRFHAGVGTGSEWENYAALGVDFDTRFKILGEHLALMKRLFNGERVGHAFINPWLSTHGGPPILIGAYASGIWVKRAARDYEGWVASAGRTNVKTLEDGIKRFKDAGGGRAVVCSVFFDLTAPNTPLQDDAPFNLRCGPEAAAERLNRLAELGFDEVILAKQPSGSLKYYEPEIEEWELNRLRSLIARDTRQAVAN
jgi:alkanesulfonate monooxygenase SsuD/methylene tetrahydromethanopterin reductase-like flavin-dependent oxidoreductase (luciferase family)